MRLLHGATTHRSSSDHGGDDAAAAASPPFQLETDTVVADGGCGTHGVEVAVSQEHLILLDTQPLQSLALVDALAKRKAPMPPNCRS